MAFPRGLWICLIIVVIQVLVVTESATKTTPRRERPIGAGRVGGLRGQPRQPPRGSAQRSTTPTEQPAVLIGSDIEMPYRLFKQIVDSYQSSERILTLLPNNQVRTVNGYAELKDTVKEFGTDTKVVISKDAMIPADIYLRVVVLNPEEVMVRRPNGEVIPNKLFKEQLGAENETKDIGGQQFFPEVPPSEFDPFLIEGNSGRPSKTDNNGPDLSSRLGLPGIDPVIEDPYGPVDPIPTLPITPHPHSESPSTIPHSPLPTSSLPPSIHDASFGHTSLPSFPSHDHQLPHSPLPTSSLSPSIHDASFGHTSLPSFPSHDHQLPHSPLPTSSLSPSIHDASFGHTSFPSFPSHDHQLPHSPFTYPTSSLPPSIHDTPFGHTSFPALPSYDHQPSELPPLDLEGLFDNFHRYPWSTYPTSYTPPTRFPHPPVAVSNYPETRSSFGEQKTYLPSGVHFVDSARCHVCDSASHAPHFTVFSV